MELKIIKWLMKGLFRRSFMDITYQKNIKEIYSFIWNELQEEYYEDTVQTIDMLTIECFVQTIKTEEYKKGIKALL